MLIMLFPIVFIRLNELYTKYTFPIRFFLLDIQLFLNLIVILFCITTKIDCKDMKTLYKQIQPVTGRRSRYLRLHKVLILQQSQQQRRYCHVRLSVRLCVRMNSQISDTISDRASKLIDNMYIFILNAHKVCCRFLTRPL